MTQKSAVKIVSRGQTGVDRAALNVALKLGFACGGWCPKGRLAEDGTISTRYPLFQTTSEDALDSIEWNVRDSDGTLILTLGRPKGDTALTIESALKLHRPCLVVDLTVPVNRQSARLWVLHNQIRTLNVSGPLGSEHPEGYFLAEEFLHDMLQDD